MPTKTYDSAYIKPEEPPPPTGPKGYRGAQPSNRPVKEGLLIAGSRGWTRHTAPAMERYVDAVVRRAGESDRRVLVGDHTHGVEAAVVAACDAHGVDCTVYGSGPQPRNPAVADSTQCRYVQTQHEMVHAGPGDDPTPRRQARPMTDAERDQHMVGAADRVLCVWNGQSPGTRSLYDYAAQTDTPTDLARPQRGRMRIVERSYDPSPQRPVPDPQPPASSPTPSADPAASSPAGNGQRVYTMGYARYDIEAVGDMLDTLDATLVDVRRSGRSRKSGFGKNQLSREFGERYAHLPQFGNVNYNNRAAGIAIDDYGGGAQALAALTEEAPDRSLILMCGCKDQHTCHRTVVAQRLADDGYDFRGDVSDLDLKAERDSITGPDDVNLQTYLVSTDDPFIAYGLYGHAVDDPPDETRPIALDAVKIWGGTDGQPLSHTSRPLAQYPTAAAMTQAAAALEATVETGGVTAFLKEAADVAGTTGPLFEVGPPDPTPLPDVTDEPAMAAMRDALSDMETTIADPLANIDLAADPDYVQFLDDLAADRASELDDAAPFTVGGSAELHEQLLAGACQLADIDPAELEQGLADSLAFQALSTETLAAAGLQPTDVHDPSLSAPPYYDADNDTALWIGVVQEKDVEAATTCVLAVREPQSPTPQAYLAPCFRGDFSAAYAAGQQLVDALDEDPDVRHFLGVAEGMARANDIHAVWTTRHGHDLDDTVADALSQHIENDAQFEVEI